MFSLIDYGYPLDQTAFVWEMPKILLRMKWMLVQPTASSMSQVVLGDKLQLLDNYPVAVLSSQTSYKDSS